MSEMSLTPEQRWDFDCRGYLCLPDFLDLETVEELATIAANYEKPHYSQSGCLLNILSQTSISNNPIFDSQSRIQPLENRWQQSLRNRWRSSERRFV